MINLTSPGACPSTVAPTTTEKAFSFLSRGWIEMRDSAGADLQLMRDRANFFRSLASSFDQELENFFNSASKSTPAIRSSPPMVVDFMRRWKALGKWSPRPRISINLLAIKNVVVSETGRSQRGRSVRFKDFRWEWKGEGRSGNAGQFGQWEPIRALKMRLRELAQKSSSSWIFVEILDVFMAHSVEVPPFDVNELLACLVRQSGSLLDQLGVRRDILDKLVESLFSGCSNQPLLSSTPSRESSILGSDKPNDELDLRIASILESTGHHDEPDLSNRKRHVAIVTTASLPWMTGTAVNPLFRAAYLAKSAKQNVTLLVLWLCQSDQELVYPNYITLRSTEEQEAYIQRWVEAGVGFEADFKISFYPGKFSGERRSIIPAGDTSQFIPSKDADIAILEEPEHLNWYHHGRHWTDKFNDVVGVVHTNYLEYIKREKNRAVQAFLVLRLSAATQDLPKSVICNVRGVNPRFLKLGEKGAYFLGKMVWAKGYRELIDLLAKHKNDLDSFKLDVFGNGEDAYEVHSMGEKLDLNLNFMRGRDHADDSLHGYKVFINPSISDVLCTATAEALVMGKFVVCADHPSNEFFRSFPNCLAYKNPEDFVAKVKEAMANEPQPLTPEQRYTLSWEAATGDLWSILSNAKLCQRTGKLMGRSPSMPNLTDAIDGGLAFVHYCLTGNEFLRLCTGAIPGTRDSDRQHSKSLNLWPTQVQNPFHGR
ncbi:Digalactosyldiacylglycerol synthase [Bertholletia excelsa]